jgi:zinc/manganese transport system substrate-binding protein
VRKPLIVLATLAVVLAGCAPADADPAADGAVRIVASTNVYGDLAQAVGGAEVEVTSVIDDPAQDPHAFEANPRVQLALSRADIVILNGGGYDDFMGTMLDASGNEQAIVIDAVEAYPHDSPNEHVWYDYDAMTAVVAAVADALDDVDPGHADAYRANLRELTGELAALGATADAAADRVAGARAIVTEPVPLYLLDRMGFQNQTPPEFSEAIEEDSDIRPALLQRTLDLIADGSTAIVVYNAQTGGPQTDAVIDAAAGSQVPAIGVTETLPDGMDYFGWQRGIQLAILAALDE